MPKARKKGHVSLCKKRRTHFPFKRPRDAIAKLFGLNKMGPRRFDIVGRAEFVEKKHVHFSKEFFVPYEAKFRERAIGFR